MPGEVSESHDKQSLAAAAENKRHRIVAAAKTLRAAGLPCPVVSLGSTPTGLASRNYDGVTELRAGVYMFFDLVQVGIGVCAMEDIALSVLATVIGHQKDKNWILTDSGWMALSADRGTAGQAGINITAWSATLTASLMAMRCCSRPIRSMA